MLDCLDRDCVQWISAGLIRSIGNLIDTVVLSTFRFCHPAISHLIDLLINAITITISHHDDNQRAPEEVVSIEHTGLSVFVLHCRKKPFGSRRTDEPGL
jgi:hypothetical protein